MPSIPSRRAGSPDPTRRIVLAYILASTAWIACTDGLLGSLGFVSARSALLAAAKDLGYVLLTTVVLHRSVSWYLAVLDASRRETLASEDHFRRALIDSPIPTSLHAEDGEILHLSHSWLEVTGYEPASIRTIADWTERAYGTRKDIVREGIDRLFSIDRRVHEGDFAVRIGDGSTRIWDFSTAPVGRLEDGRRIVISVAQDVTERRQAEAALARLNRLYAMLSQTNQLLVRAASRDQLLEGVCRIAVEYGGFQFARIGLQSPDGSMRPVARAGLDRGFIDAACTGGLDPASLSRGPASRDPASGTRTVTGDLLADPAAAPRHDLALGTGVEAVATFPIHRGDRVIGTIQLGSVEPVSFTDTELGTLNEMALDVSFGLEHLEIARGLKQSEHRLRGILDAVHVGIALLDDSGRIAHLNPALQRIWKGARYVGIDGYGEYRGWWLDSGQLIRPHEWAGARAIEKGETSIDELLEIECFDGSRRIILNSAVPLRDDCGQIRGAVSVNHDITDYHRAEAALHASEALNRSIVENAPDLVFINRDDRVLFVNPAGVRLLRATSTEELIGRPILELFHPPCRDLVLDRIARLRARPGTVVPVISEKLLARDGTVLDAEVHAVSYWNGEHLDIQVVCRDTTDFERTRRELAASEERLRLALEAAHQGIYDIDLRTGRITFNPEYARLLYHVPVTTEEWLRLVHPQDRDSVESLRNSYLAGLAPEYRVEFRQQIRGEDGWRWFLSVGRVVERDAEGAPIRMMGTHTDTHDRKLAEERLRQSESRYRELFASNPHPMWVYDLDSLTFLDVNDAAIAHYGYSRDEFLGMTLTEIRPAEERARFLDHMTRRWNRRPLEPAGVWRHVRKDGTQIDVEIMDHTLLFEDRPAAMVLALDITEKRRAERAIRDSEARFRTLVEAAPVGIVIEALDRFVYANQAAVSLLGARDASELIGQPILERFEASDRSLVLDRLQALRETQQAPAPAEHRLIRLDGSTVASEIVAVPFRVGEELGALAFVHDIAARKEAEQALAESAGKLRELTRQLLQVQEKERRSLARELHDEIGQALTAVKINLQAAIRAPNEARSRLDEAMELVGRTLEQVRGLALDLRPSLLDDLGLVAALGWYVRRCAERTGLEGTFRCESEAVVVDEQVATAIFRACQESLTNMARHARATRFQVELVVDPAGVELVVRDDGVGFDPERAIARATAGGSVGLLGLRERVEILGGQARWVTSPGEGTEVRITFPAPSCSPFEDEAS